MPIDAQGRDLSPDEAIAEGLCAECAAALSSLNAEEHILMHWARGMSAEARRRAELIREKVKELAAAAVHELKPDQEVKG